MILVDFNNPVCFCIKTRRFGNLCWSTLTRRSIRQTEWLGTLPATQSTAVKQISANYKQMLPKTVVHMLNRGPHLSIVAFLVATNVRINISFPSSGLKIVPWVLEIETSMLCKMLSTYKSTRSYNTEDRCRHLLTPVDYAIFRTVFCLSAERFCI